MGELANCSQCGNLFVKQVRDFCLDCHKKTESNFQIALAYLMERENKNATVKMIAEATGINEMVLYKFVKERRLNPIRFPNLAYPCEKCGEKIQEGRLCRSCALEITDELAKQAKIDSVSSRNKKVYYSTGGKRNN